MAKRAGKKKKSPGRRRRSNLPPPSFLEMHGRSLAILAAFLVIIAIGAYLVLTLEPGGNGDGDGSPDTKAAPGFHLVSIEGEPLELEAYRGRVVVLDLFATWCEPCKRQMDELNQLRAAYPETDVVIISVDADPRETEQQALDFKVEHNAQWPFAMDTDGLAAKYDLEGYPTLAVIDRDGNLAWRHQGFANFGQLDSHVRPLL